MQETKHVDLIPGSGRSSGGGNGNPLQYSCLENPLDRGDWQATVHGVSKSWAQLSGWPQHSTAPEEIEMSPCPKEFLEYRIIFIICVKFLKWWKDTAQVFWGSFQSESRHRTSTAGRAHILDSLSLIKLIQDVTSWLCKTRCAQWDSASELKNHRTYKHHAHHSKTWKDEHAWGLHRSVMSDSLWPHGLYPTSLLCPWSWPG